MTVNAAATKPLSQVRAQNNHKKPMSLKRQTNQKKYTRLYHKNDPTKALGAGAHAPDFNLKSTPDQNVSRSDFRGQPLILAFFPADWSPVCGDQMTLFNEILPEFQKFGAELIGISVDGVWCHTAFARERKLHFPLLSDFEPKGDVARSYGVYRKTDGVTERALFVIDGNGIIQ